MINVYAIRLFKENYGDILDVVDLFRKISEHTIITEEINPYQHYHLMVYSDKTLYQMKRYVSNHSKGYKVRGQKNTNVQVVQNEPAYRRYIQKDYVRGFDSVSGWMCNLPDYEYGFDETKPDSENTIDHMMENFDKAKEIGSYNDLAKWIKKHNRIIVNEEYFINLPKKLLPSN